MARKNLVIVGVKSKGRGWSITIDSGDQVLRAEVALAGEHARERGLQILNSADPLASLTFKAREAKITPVELPGVE